MEKNKKRSKRLWKHLCIAVIVFLCVLGSLILWQESVETQAYVRPEYPMESIELLINKNFLAGEDYKLLFQQTGLSTAAVDFLRTNNRQQELLELQQLFFADVEVGCEANTIISKEERIEEVKLPIKDRGRVKIPHLEEGDILITFNCHAFGWRNGHVALVVDDEERLALEARVLGTDSSIGAMAHWERYPSFAVLRLKGVSKELRSEVAAYAAENLVDVPYRLEAGIWKRMKTLIMGKHEQLLEDEEGMIQNEIPAVLSGTHCAHLIWYAYEQFGYDLDSDGGVIVTPRDIYESPFLEIIQIYGM